MDAGKLRAALNAATPQARLWCMREWLNMVENEPLLSGSPLVADAAHWIENAEYMHGIDATAKMQHSMQKVAQLQEQVQAEIETAVRSEKARNAQAAKGENPIHDEIERLGRRAAFDHEPHEITRTVRRWLPASDRLGEKQVRRVLQDRGVIQKRT